MREWIVLIESMAPDWFQEGKVIDILDPKWDAAEFLEPGEEDGPGNEFEWEWRYCKVPADVVSPRLLDPEESDPRITDINKWLVDEPDGIWDSPPLGVFTGTELYLLDGNHRSHVMKGRGEEEIPVLVSFQPNFKGF